MSSYVTQVVIEGKDGTKAAVASASKGIQSYAKTARAANKTVQASSRMARSSIQQIGYQAQDVAVQLQAGQNPFLVLSQQGSQVASIFGPGGAVAGAFIAIAGIIGMNLVPSLFESSDAMEELKEKAKELNKELGEIAPFAAGREEYQNGLKYAELQDKIAEKVSDLNDLRMRSIELAKNGGKSNLLFGDSWDELAEKIQNGTIELENLAVQLSTHQKQVEGLEQVYNPFIRVYEEYLKNEEERQKLIREAETPLQKLQRRTQEIIELEKKHSLGKEWLTEMIKKEGDAYESTLPKKEKEVDLTERQAEAYERLKRSLDPNYAAYQNYYDVVTQINQSSASHAEKTRYIAIAYAKLYEAVNPVTEKVKEQADTWDWSKSSVEDYQDSIEDLEGAIDSTAMGAIKSMEDALVDLIGGTSSVEDAFRSMASSIVKDLIRIQMQQSIMGPLSGLLSKGIGSIVGSMTGNPYLSDGGGMPLADGNDWNNFSGGGYTGMGARSGGVDGKGGFPAILHPNETVVDHAQGQSLGEGVTINQTIQISTGVQQTVRAEIANLLPQISNAAKSAVADARQRGGGFSKAMGA